MLLTLALIVLFTITTLTVGGVLADSALKGVRAYGELTRTLRSGDMAVRQVRLVQQYEMGALPACRSHKPSRPAIQRPALRSARCRTIAAA